MSILARGSGSETEGFAQSPRAQSEVDLVKRPCKSKGERGTEGPPVRLKTIQQFAHR